jgi:pimeloyl-ACP methyl ester carboxylesterase
VLVHGAWADSSSWDAVVSRLQRDGYTVYVPPNPLLGLTYDSSFIRDFLNTIPGPIVLVGHSYGGAVITNAATGDTQVKALVYVDAFAPAQGQTIGQLVTAHPGSCVLPAANVIAQPYPGAPTGAADVYIKQTVFGSCMANGLPARQAAVLAATQRPLTSLALAQKSGVPAWNTIPSWAVIGTADHAIPPAELLAMAKQAHARITMAPGAPHLAMIYDPGLVTTVILKAVHATT